MKILFSAGDYPTPTQPFAAFVGDICREFTKQGHTVTVIAPQSITTWLKGNRKLLPRFSVDKVSVGKEYRDIKVYRPYYITFKQFNFFKTFVVNLIANKLEKPDICYAHFWTSGYRIVKYAKRNKIPLFVASGEDIISLHKGLIKKELSYIRRYTKGVICVSTKNKTESVNSGFTTEDKCIVLPNSIDNNIFYPRDKEKVRKELGYKDSDFIVVFVGRFDARKGVMRVSAAIKELKDDDIKSIFIGKSSLGENEEPDCDGILFKGVLPHEEVPKYLSAADVFVLPTLAEGCSNSIIEAMACGLPIISSDLPFNYDILNSSNSLLVDPNNILSIAQQIKKLKDHKEIRIRMGENALKSVASLNLPNRVSKIMNFIRGKITK